MPDIPQEQIQAVEQGVEVVKIARKSRWKIWLLVSLLSAVGLGVACTIYNDRYREMTDEQIHEILKDKIKYPPPRIIERKPVQKIEENDSEKGQEPNKNDSKGKGENRNNNDYNLDDGNEVKLA